MSAWLQLNAPIFQHLQREFLNINNEVYKNDSGVIVIYTDYVERHHIGSDDIMNDAYTQHCKGNDKYQYIIYRPELNNEDR